MKIENKIIQVLLGKDYADSWDIANAIYDNCMNSSKPGNGGRITAIKKACNKSATIRVAEDDLYFLTKSK